jgi:cyclic pyranopterin phosphate synthase
MEQLVDRFGRKIDYIRISVTDRCNFRCIYCMPESGIDWKPMENLLSYEDMAFFMRVAGRLGIRKVKLTGGEPLVRKHLDNLVALIKDIDEIEEVSLTTNATMLPIYAERLKRAGLDRITVSLDTLSEDKFRQITRMGSIKDVLLGLDAVDSAGFKKTKINTVVMKTINDNEIVDLINFAHNRDYDIRFIELMPTELIPNWKKFFISVKDIKELIRQKFDIERTDKKTNGPSVYYKLKSGYVGFITPLSKAFCAACNRIRLSSEGEIVTCLGHNINVNVKGAIVSRNEEMVEKLIHHSIKIKPKEHSMLNESIHSTMSAIGG